MQKNLLYLQIVTMQRRYLLVEDSKVGIPRVLDIAQPQGNPSEGTRAMGCKGSCNAQLDAMQTMRTRHRST